MASFRWAGNTKNMNWYKIMTGIAKNILETGLEESNKQQINNNREAELKHSNEKVLMSNLHLDKSEDMHLASPFYVQRSPEWVT